MSHITHNLDLLLVDLRPPHLSTEFTNIIFRFRNYQPIDKALIQARGEIQNRTLLLKVLKDTVTLNLLRVHNLPTHNHIHNGENS